MTPLRVVVVSLDFLRERKASIDLGRAELHICQVCTWLQFTSEKVVMA